MSCLLLCLFVAIVEPVVIFLVWRNNKRKFVEALEEVDDNAIVKKIKDLLGK